MKKTPWALVLLFFFSCTPYYGQLDHKAELPFLLDENSGMVTYDGKTIWIIEDNGNKDDIYQLDLEGNILKSFEVKNAGNDDWEDLATDKAGNLYIADIGNNDNERDDLVIYKLPNPHTEPGDKIDAKKIRFNYPEQEDFPPKKSERYFDAEAMYHWDGFLYILTKNRSHPFKGDAYLYRVPDTPGKYDATFISRVQICNDSGTCQVTAMDISADGKKVIALGYGKLFVFTAFEGPDFSKGKKEVIDLCARSQLESLCFKNDSTLLLSDERTISGKGCNLYEFKL